MSLSETTRASRKARNGASTPSRDTPTEKPSVRIAKSADAAFTKQDALAFHQMGKPGKLEIMATKPVVTQRDLSLAYSPGVAIPVQAIAEDPSRAYDYTAKGNLVAVISNGTAILGLGNLGALASKPVMEGKAVLFKRFADVDAFDLEVGTEDVDAFIASVRYLGPSFGGINLEDIKAPDCFIIEQRLRELMDIPVFHDDQHGTAIIAVAGLINALHLTGRELSDVKFVCNGAGAAGIACLELIKALGLPHENAILCDTRGVVYQRPRERHEPVEDGPCRSDPSARTLADALEGADVFFGLSAAGVGHQGHGGVDGRQADHLRDGQSRSRDHPGGGRRGEERCDHRHRPVGLSEPDQQCAGLPLYLPRRARRAGPHHQRRDEDRRRQCAGRARPRGRAGQGRAAYQGRSLRYGAEYLIPAPFDPRLISRVPAAVAKAAMDSGVARRPIANLDSYKAKLDGRLDPAAAFLHSIFAQLRESPKRVVFAEGEEHRVVRAANAYLNSGLGEPVLVGRETPILDAFRASGLTYRNGIEICNARLSHQNREYAEFLYARLQRQGYLFRDCQRLVNTDRNVFAACMVACGHADAMVTGTTRNWSTAFQDIRQALDPKPGRTVIGVSLVISRGRSVLVADTSVHDMPDAEQLANIACEAAKVGKRLGFEPRVAMLAYSTFGHPKGERSERVREAVKILDSRGVDFEYDGEMAADVALSRKAMALYPFCRLSDTANVLVMPAFHSASISTKMLQELGGGTVIGPLLVGLSKPVQIASLASTDSDLVNMAALAAYDISG